jgi:hypothetical protein
MQAERLSSFNLWGIIKFLSWVLFGIGLPVSNWWLQLL